jgi:hypothetical protein
VHRTPLDAPGGALSDPIKSDYAPAAGLPEALTLAPTRPMGTVVVDLGGAGGLA